MRETSRVKTFLAPLIAFLIPGGGHLLLGRAAAGLLLLLGTLTDIAAIIRLADESGGQFALFIIFLGLGVPCFWFYSVFGTLQLAAKLRREGQHPEADQDGHGAGLTVILQGIAAVGLSCVLLVLVQTSLDFSPLIEAFGTYAPGLLLCMLALLIVLRRKNAVVKMGRYTVAAVLVAVGALLLWDQMQGRNDIGLLGQWWPAAFVLLGIEIVISSMAYRKSSRRLSFDIGGALLAAVITITAFAVTQYAAMPFRWLDEFKVNLTGTSGFGEEKGFRYVKDAIHQPLLPETTAITIDNTNGNVTVKKGDVDGVVVETVMWVDSSDKDEADDTAEKSTVEVNGGGKLEIKAQGHPYGTNGERKPRMNMIVTIPADSPFVTKAQPPVVDNDTAASHNTSATNLAAEDAGNGTNGAAGTDGTNSNNSTNGSNGTGNTDGANAATSDQGSTSNKVDSPKNELRIGTVNGSVEAADLRLTGGLTIKVTSGEITVHHMYGPVDAETKNGSIAATELEGNVTLDTYNGDIKAADITGGFDGSTLSGNIDLQRVTGDVDTDTKNGQIGINEAQSTVRADTLNGDIQISSSTVGGDWDINSSIGEIHVQIPEMGNYSVNGSVTFGDVASDLPLTINKKTIRGTIGSGTYRINIDANSSIEVNRHKP
ncbi:DUF4097 domain-containing protein [Paenibacillus rhizovicinus]|uniref:DUF4097 domain-containing protein n=1 Tax=Paenibacillus rhizovicinus TaxID=2704463 RepID=A0A6C0P9C3_9BACL|nr:DUF4097 family beta strand repeat-containing protein [Paenibacillus rhizovicinus]QHW33132.1 DUF4097 domain-containing protein [Paenibacillus rhizovicinus]